MRIKVHFAVFAGSQEAPKLVPESWVLTACDANQLSFELLSSSKIHRGFFISGSSSRTTLYLECLPKACQGPTFPFQRFIRPSSTWKPSGIATERNLQSALCSHGSLHSPGMYQSHCLIHSGSIPLMYSLRWVFTVNKTEVAPLPVDFTEINK